MLTEYTELPVFCIVATMLDYRVGLQPLCNDKVGVVQIASIFAAFANPIRMKQSAQSRDNSNLAQHCDGMDRG